MSHYTCHGKRVIIPVMEKGPLYLSWGKKVIVPVMGKESLYLSWERDIVLITRNMPVYMLWEKGNYTCDGNKFVIHDLVIQSFYMSLWRSPYNCHDNDVME